MHAAANYRRAVAFAQFATSSVRGMANLCVRRNARFGPVSRGLVFVAGLLCIYLLVHFSSNVRVVPW